MYLLSALVCMITESPAHFLCNPKFIVDADSNLALKLALKCLNTGICIHSGQKIDDVDFQLTRSRFFF